jgi:hypothetical protein
MATPTQNVITNLLNLGVYDIILFALFAAIFYAMLRKMKILGDSAILNGVISIGISFLIFGFPVITGMGSLVTYFSTFFTQVSVILLIFFIGVLIASFFYPDLPGMLTKTFVNRTTLVALLALGAILFLTSGLINVFQLGGPATGTTTGSTKTGGPPPNVNILIVGIGIFIFMLIIASAVVRGV